MRVAIGRILIRILPIVYMVFIWIQSSRFNPESVYSLSGRIPMEILLILGMCLELAHLFEFGLLYCLLIIALISIKPLTRAQNYLALLFSISYAALDEIHQHFVPFRSTSFEDLVKDMIGILLIWWIVKRTYIDKRSSRVGKLMTEITHRLGNSHEEKL
ncbi:VanZ family protein [Pseudalkalibacillus caeni]|nr:VanZ family protein [Pseudalkalibacillus caeni]